MITGGGESVEIKVHADPPHQHLLVTAEEKFWRCVQTGRAQSCSRSTRLGRGSRRSNSGRISDRVEIELEAGKSTREDPLYRLWPLSDHAPCPLLRL